MPLNLGDNVDDKQFLQRAMFWELTVALRRPAVIIVCLARRG